MPIPKANGLDIRIIKVGGYVWAFAVIKVRRPPSVANYGIWQPL